MKLIKLMTLSKNTTPKYCRQNYLIFSPVSVIVLFIFFSLLLTIHSAEAYPVVKWQKVTSITERLWTTINLDIFFSDSERIIGLDLVATGSTQLGKTRMVALGKKAPDRNHMQFHIQLKSSDDTIKMVKAELLYRVGTDTRILKRELNFPTFKIQKWLFYLVIIIIPVCGLIIVGYFFYRKRNKAAKSDVCVGAVIPDEKSRTDLARYLNNEDYTGFFRALKEIEGMTGLSFPMSPDNRDRIVYGGDRELTRDLPRQLQKYMKEFRVEEEISYE